MERPLSPSSTSSGGAAHPAERRQARITRTQVVETAAHEAGVRTNLYLRISLPVNETVFPQAHHLLALTPLSHLLHHSTYSLPLRFSLGSSSTDAIAAARKLNVPLLDDSSGVDPGAATVGRAEGRRGGGVFPHSTSREPQAEVRLKQNDKDVQLWLDPAPPAVRSRSPTSDASALIPAGTRRRADSAAANTGEDRVEYIVVLRVETAFGGLQSPRFANTIILPLPPCLRNTLSFTLPPAAISSPWDLSVRPQLRMRPSPTGPNPDGSPDRTIHGSFTSTPLLQLVWTPRDVSDAPLVLARTSLEIHWSIGETGYGRADVRVYGEVEQYAGLREKATVELAVVVGACDQDAGRMWDVLKVEGDVLNWEIDTGAKTLPEIKRKSAKAADDSTPVRRARPPKAGPTPISQRPPSFTSLFDTPEPVAPMLDPATLQRMKAPSLLGTEAPFEEGASLDMTFELESESSENPLPLVYSASSAAGSSVSTDTDALEPERPTSALSQASDAAPVLLRIQLPMSKILTPTTHASPSFSLSASFSFPSVTLLALHSAFTPSPATSTPFRLSLPTFSLPASKAEDTVVTVSAGIGGSVELLGAAPLIGEDDSPLPALGGKARWRTERSSPEPIAAKRHGRNKSERVEVEVKLPAARPTSIVLIDPMPSPPLLPSPLSPWNNTLTSKPSLLSVAVPSPVASSRCSRASSISTTTLPPFKTRLTPVAPLAAHLPWRIFAHVTFAHPFTGSFDLPLRDGAGAEGQTVEVCSAWDGDGRSVELPSEYFDVKGEARRLRVGPCEEGVKEVQYVVAEMAADDGRVRVGDVLPRFGQRVAEMQVEVLDASGHQLHADSHTFDTATPKGSSTTFTRFLLAPSSTSRLGAFLRPSHRDSIITTVAPLLAPTKSKPPPSPPAKAKSKAKDQLQGSDSSIAPKIMAVLMLLCILAPIFFVFLPSFLPSDGAPDVHSADEIQRILSNVMRGPPPTVDPFAPTALPITPTALALTPSPTSTSTLAPPPPPEEIRGKEIEVPFDADAFDWSFGAWRAVPLQLGLRGREIVVGLLRWLGLA